MKLIIDKSHFKDVDGRTVILRGINVAGDAKGPVPLSASKGSSDSPGYSIASCAAAHQSGDEISYVDSPFNLEEADTHFNRIIQSGFNVIRYIFTWDALEHAGPGIYDEEYIDFTIKVLRKLEKYKDRVSVFMDPHQDVWSRYSGGSGAPLWTLYAAGMDPEGFADTLAAVFYDDMKEKIKMIWSSNYHRLVSLTMFTLFFAGDVFAPKCLINGVNIGEYLESHYLNAVEYFASRIRAVPELTDIVIGWESLNEPGHGLIGNGDLTLLPVEVGHVKLGTAPTPYEAMVLGEGRPATIDCYVFTTMGPKKLSPVTVTPKRTAWLTPEKRQALDAKYKWSRDPEWVPGCIWRLHGLYDDKRVLKRFYFNVDNTGTPMDDRAFVEKYFVLHYRKYAKMIRRISEEWILFLQTPVNQLPPLMNSDDVIDSRTVFAPHYYDGLTLLNKRWNRLFNVDSLGVLRGHYALPVLSVRLGERSIRSSFRDQLGRLRQEGTERIGDIPCLISEIGIPYDMDDKAAYQHGDYTSQIKALDANYTGLEYNQLHHTLWVYTANSRHKTGDNWNGEDLSIWSKDDEKPELGDNYWNGMRAAESLIRPYPLAVRGTIVSFRFSLYRGCFTLKIDAREKSNTPTLIYLPSYYFSETETGISTSSGTWKRDGQILEWRHFGGPQTLQVKAPPKAKDPGCRIS